MSNSPGRVGEVVGCVVGFRRFVEERVLTPLRKKTNKKKTMGPNGTEDILEYIYLNKLFTQPSCTCSLIHVPSGDSEKYEGKHTQVVSDVSLAEKQVSISLVFKELLTFTH